MVNVLFHATSKPGLEAQMRELLVEMMRVTHEQDDPVTYTFHVKRGAPDQWMLYEQWRDRPHAEAHVANMKRHFGEPPPGAKLPARMQALVESHSMTFYDLLS